MTALAKTENAAQLPAPTTPMEMLDRAIASGASVEIMSKLMDLQERWEKNQARRAFDAAVAAAKAKIPIIAKNKNGHNNKRYADFAAIARTIDPIINEFGLSYRFRTRQDDRIHVTCILSHVDGHSEENPLAGPADKTGNKNDIQAIGSTLTYLQRYTLMQALGLAASEDDDGRVAGTGTVTTITEEQAANLVEMMESISYDRQKFLAHFKIETVDALPADRYGVAVASIKKIIDKRQAAGAAA